MNAATGDAVVDLLLLDAAELFDEIDLKCERRPAPANDPPTLIERCGECWACRAAALLERLPVESPWICGDCNAFNPGRQRDAETCCDWCLEKRDDRAYALAYGARRARRAELAEASCEHRSIEQLHYIEHGERHCAGCKS